MRRFLIKVNGKDYDVAVEEIGAGVPMPSMSMPAAPVAPAAPAPQHPLLRPPPLKRLRRQQNSLPPRPWISLL